MKALDHSAVSELLERYIAGHLDDETGAAVAAHVRACTQCRREETGLRSLLAPIDGLTPSERSRLRTGLATALSGETQGSAEVVPLRRPLLARLAPALGAAALLAIVVVALARLDFAPQSGDDSGASAPSAETGAVQDAPRVAPEALQAEVAPVEPVFNSDAGELQVGDLRRLGRSGFSGVEPAEGTDAVAAGAGKPAAQTRVGDLDFYRDPMLGSLIDASGDTQVAECANSVFAGGYARIAPIYGAFGEYDDRRVLVLGFLWSSKDKGPLDSYTIWVWPRNSCAVALRTFSGSVRH